jgi:hypothetical protein
MAIKLYTTATIAVDMSSLCNTCQKPIKWDKTQRDKLEIKGPLNEDGQTAHYCYATAKAQTLNKVASRLREPNEDRFSQLEKRVTAVEAWIKKLSESYQPQP